MANFTADLVDAVEAELERFGGRKEADDTVRGLLTEYWTVGAGRSGRAISTQGTP